MTDDFPDDVIIALARGRKIEAIKLLREQRNIDLKSAKDTVESYQKQYPEIIEKKAKVYGYTPRAKTQKKFRDVAVTLSIVAVFIWAFINIANVVAGIIIIMNQSGYIKTTFTVTKLMYTNHHDTGLRWGFQGELADGKAKFYAPDLADAETLGYPGLMKRFPPGTILDVWYNPAVTDELFQGRTLQVIPYTADLVESEIRRILWWVNYCLLPLIAILYLAFKLREKEKTKQP